MSSSPSSSAAPSTSAREMATQALAGKYAPVTLLSGRVADFHDREEFTTFSDIKVFAIMENVHVGGLLSLD